MSGIIVSENEIMDFLGNIDLHMLKIKAQWQIYMDSSNDQATRDAAKQSTIDALNTIQQILNTIASPIGMTLSTDELSDTEVVKYAIMPE